MFEWDMTLVQWFAAGELLAAIVAAFSLIVAVSSFWLEKDKQRYIELERGYYDVLRLVVEKPELDKPHEGTSYSAFAYIVFNYLETIYDNCKHKPKLQETWYPVVGVEGVKHSAWFRDPNNKEKFKEEFYFWMLERIAQEERKSRSGKKPA